jgi:hypothetical protein
MITKIKNKYIYIDVGIQTIAYDLDLFISHTLKHILV